MRVLGGLAIASLIVLGGCGGHDEEYYGLHLDEACEKLSHCQMKDVYNDDECGAAYRVVFLRQFHKQESDPDVCSQAPLSKP